MPSEFLLKLQIIRGNNSDVPRILIGDDPVVFVDKAISLGYKNRSNGINM